MKVKHTNQTSQSTKVIKTTFIPSSTTCIKPPSILSQSIIQYNSIPEKKMAEALQSAGIHYSYQVPLANGFILDFVINNTNLAVEVDGEFWHRDKHKDKRRDAINSKDYVYRQGYRTLRFTATQVCENANWCIQQILASLI